ncbi:hypothetical protein B6I21_04090 [candidate division KSB1 bacterium 4572_119]|nr:MAG: hypothetical protein B6I21_04090 [candidate division KSB1 bacterium 4572_119]
MVSAKQLNQDEKFLEELIDRFFDPKSYFYHVFINQLKDKTFLEKMDNLIFRVFTSLFEYLVTSENASKELTEISLIQGFDVFYFNFKKKLAEANFSNLSQSETKGFIRELALFTMKDWQVLLSQNKQRNLVTSYIDLKTKIKTLIKNHDGSDTYISKEFINYDNEEQREDTRPDSFSFLPDEILDLQIEKKLAFEKFFKEEIKKVVSVVDDSWAKYKQDNNSEEFVEKIKNIFYKLNELAKFHDYEMIHKISQRIFNIYDKLFEDKLAFEEKYLSFVERAKTEILAGFQNEWDSDNIKELIQNLDNSIWELDGGFQNGSPGQIDLPNETLFANTQNVEYNTVQNNETQKDEINFPGLGPASLADLPENMDLIGKDKNGKKVPFVMPGEENEELLNLIHDISLTMSIPAGKKPAGSGNGFSELADPNHTLDEETGIEKKVETITFSGFIIQAKLFFQVIQESALDLKKGENTSAALEDMELASVSLNELALKLGFEQIGIFPELIESICVNARKANLKLPDKLLESIEQGILLLQDFNPENTDNESKLISILSTLKDYYEYTLKAIDQTSLKK